jgi:hypothetical protein
MISGKIMILGMISTNETLEVNNEIASLVRMKCPGKIENKIAR